MHINNWEKDVGDIYKNIAVSNEKQIPLCAAENIISSYVRKPLTSFIHEKYILGGISKYDPYNNFLGSENLFELYNLLNRQCSDIFNSKYADARTLSGINALITLLMSLFEQGDRVLITDSEYGGHSSLKKICDRLGLQNDVIPYDYKKMDFDYDKLNKIIKEKDVDGIIVCLSDMIKQPELKNICLREKTILIYDATQILGFIASKDIENPFDWFSDEQNFILMGATHKTLPGPTCGLIMARNLELCSRFDKKVNPDFLRNTQLHHVLSLIFALTEFDEFGEMYMRDIVNNVNHLSFFLLEKGFEIIRCDGGFSKTHQIFIRIANNYKKYLDDLSRNNISVTARKRKIFNNSGIRIGLQAVSRFGWQKDEMEKISIIFKNILLNENFKETKEIINELSAKKTIKYTFEKQEGDNWIDR